MTSIEKLQANIDAYRAPLDDTTVQDMIEILAKQARNSLDQIAYETLTGRVPKGGLVVAERIEVFTVYAAKNGYYAEFPNSGDMVIGITLSECCSAAQAAVAANKIAGVEESESPMFNQNLWKRLL